MIEVEHLTKRYGDQLAVSDVGFRVEAGEIVGFLGPNGAGKSTTLRMLTGYLLPNAGRIRIGHVDALHKPAEARRLLGYLPESVPLYREMRVHEYLAYRATLKGVPRRQVAARVAASLEQANVADVAQRIIGQLSKGYRSRVGLADALVADPPILILDEPTAGLDPNQIRQVRELIRGLAGHKTVLLSTHILPEVESTCGRVLIINRGRLVGEGSPDDLRRARMRGQLLILRAPGPLPPLLAAVTEAQGVLEVVDQSLGEDGLAEVRLRVEQPAVAEAIFTAVASAGLSLRELRPEQTSLEDVFTQLTTTDRAATEGVPSSAAVSQEPNVTTQEDQGAAS